MIQVATRRSNEGVKTCRIHDLLRDLCITKSAEENLLYVPRDDNHSSWNSSRRLSIQSRILHQFISSNTSSPSYACSFLSFGSEFGLKFEEIHWKWVHNNLKMLRVLHLELDAHFIPQEIGTFIHLKYLKIRLRGYKLRAIPTSIGNLKNLETLVITTFFERECLPNSIMKLTRLRSLCGEVILPDNHSVTALWNLQVLSVQLFDSQIVHLIVGGKIPNIRKLGLMRDECSQPLGGWDLEGILASVHHLRHLQTLKIKDFGGRIISLHNSLFPETITKISLSGVSLDEGGMEVLGKLPKLWILKLEYCLSSVGLIHMRAHSFLQLQFLKLHEGEIERWTQEEGVMPGLRHLVIHECFDLTMLPSELRSLTALREVQVLRSNLYLANKFQRLQMELNFELLIYPPLHTDFYVNPSGNCHKWR